MNNAPSTAQNLAEGCNPAPRRAFRLVLLLLGILAAQAVLYGPSLTGSKILLPLDLLAVPGYYLPRNAETARIIPHNGVLSDLVSIVDPSRRFSGREMRAGRTPLWNPYQYAGAPYTGAKLSPFYTLGAWIESPRILAWIQVLAALVAGTGAYVFCRRVLGVGFRPAVITAWCYPLIPFFIYWQGYGLEFNVIWLPWMLMGVERAVRKSDALSIAGLGLSSGLVLVSGQLDVAAQVLLVSGLFAVWRLFDLLRGQWFSRRALAAVAALSMGWGIGFLVAAPDMLLTLEYSKTGERMAHRSEGTEERPPVGLAALPEVVWPTVYGSTESGSFPIFPKGQRYLPESAATGYAGLLALLLVAPLGWCQRRRRAAMLFFTALGFVALGWTLNVPGLVTLLRLPGLNMLSYNRLVFATAFSILAMVALGLEALERGAVRRRSWFAIPVAMLGALLLWCTWRTVFLPEAIGTKLAGRIRDLGQMEAVLGWFLDSQLVCAVLCVVGILGWLAFWRGTTWKPQWSWALGALLIGDLLWYGVGRSAQCDEAMYFPPIPALEEAAQSGPGRFLGVSCLPANTGSALGLSFIQGYDAVDPARLMDLMRIAAAPASRTNGPAMTQWFIPDFAVTPPDGLRLSPVLDMLAVRYVVFRGKVPVDARPAFQSPDYWILVNRNALPRAFVPSRVETVLDAKERLAKLAARQFNAREVAYVETPVSLPDACRGSVQIVDEVPCRITLSAHMETPGLVVLADLWDTGWRAFVDGNPVPVLRANHAVRGVIVPAGDHALEFRYEPASVALGWRLAGLGTVGLMGAFGVAAWKRRLIRA